jgi:hypothetical protein
LSFDKSVQFKHKANQKVQVFGPGGDLRHRGADSTGAIGETGKNVTKIAANPQLCHLKTSRPCQKFLKYGCFAGWYVV